METQEIAEVVRLHGLWLAGQEGGEKANLRGADLTRADLPLASLSLPHSPLPGYRPTPSSPPLSPPAHYHPSLTPPPHTPRTLSPIVNTPTPLHRTRANTMRRCGGAHHVTATLCRYLSIPIYPALSSPPYPLSLSSHTRFCVRCKNMACCPRATRWVR